MSENRQETRKIQKMATDKGFGKHDKFYWKEVSKRRKAKKENKHGR